MFEWIEDNSLTPYILVDATIIGVEVPVQYVRNGRIVLNISTSAVRDLLLKNTDITFAARFGGIAHSIYVPIAAVLAIYAKENGKGMFFEQDGDIQPPPPHDGQAESKGDAPGKKDKKKTGRPNLKVIK